MAAGDKTHPDIWGMSYNSERDELFLADDNNGVVCAMRVRDNAGDLRDVYRAPHDTTPFIYSVPHERLGHTAHVLGRLLSGGTEPQRQRTTAVRQPVLFASC